jgi:hypothetical protein
MAFQAHSRAFVYCPAVYCYRHGHRWVLAPSGALRSGDDRSAAAHPVAGAPAQPCLPDRYRRLLVVVDDGHLAAVHPQGDALSGELVAHVQLATGQAGSVDHPVDVDCGAGSGWQWWWPGRAGAVGGQAGKLDDA